MGRVKGRAFWERVVADVETGLAQTEAARRHGVSPSGLGYWVRRLRQERARRPEPQLLPVRVTSALAPPRRCGLVLGDHRLEFEEGTAPEYVAALARALRSC